MFKIQMCLLRMFSAFVMLAVSGITHALVLAINDEDGYTEYLGVTGALTGRSAPFRILVPDAWDGTLMVYSRGTGSAVLIQIDGSPVLDASGLPILATNPLANVPNQAFPPGVYDKHDALEEELLGRGYALATSDYKPDPRFINEGRLAWVVEDGFRDTTALTLQARSLLRRTYGQLPERTIHWGRSQGSAIGFKLAEDKLTSKMFDGFVEGCTIGAGTPLVWDTGLTFALAFDTAFKAQGGWLSAWGDPGGGNIPDTISFATDVAPVLGALLANPANYPLFEFVRLVSGLPQEEFYPPFGFPNPGSLEFNWLFISMLFLTEVRGDLESGYKANGRISQNLDHVYSLSEDDKAYLAAISGGALDEDNVNALLNVMDQRVTYQADVKARKYVKRFYETKGKLRVKTLTMHGKLDGLAIPANETVLKNRAVTRGKGDNLVQVFTESPGHCNFSVDQWVSAIDAMNDWIGTGTKPDESFFQAEGFDNVYVSPPWPQPVD